MSRTRGEGRAPAEKAGRFIDPAFKARARARRKREDQAWAARSGEVTSTFVATPDVGDQVDERLTWLECQIRVDEVERAAKLLRERAGERPWPEHFTAGAEWAIRQLTNDALMHRRRGKELEERG